MDPPPEIVAILAPFAPLFSDRAWANAQVLAVGALPVNGRRTLASYGGRRKAMRVVTGAGLWHAPNLDPVPIRWVLARDPDGQHRDAAYPCTDEGFTADRILGLVVRRWTPEVTFGEAPRHLGVETQRQWSDRAIERTTVALLGLYSIVTLLSLDGHGEGALSAGRAAWYAKAEPTFSDCPALTRQRIWRSRNTAGSGAAGEAPRLPRPLLEALIHGLSRAA